MSFFQKNPNEVNYTGGRKHWADVIKNTGSGDLLIFRQPEEDFNTNSTLIVMPGEEAIFVKGGEIYQTFTQGTYTLSTDNYPFISRLKNAFTGGISTFNCVVYFVRKADSKELLWGTASPILVRDNFWKIQTEVRARGSYKVRVENPAMFLSKLFGNNVPFQTQQDLDDYFANEFQGKVKSVVARYLNSLEHELIGIDAYMDELADSIQPSVNGILSDYGLKCVSFVLSGLDVDKTKYDTVDRSQLDKISLNILGDDWAKVQNVEILKNISNNPGAGGIVSAGAGLGLGFGAMGTFGNMQQETFGNVKKSDEVVTQKAPMEVLTDLKKMLDAGLIEQSEYDAKKAEILSRM